jgi:hypothetical protein
VFRLSQNLSKRIIVLLVVWLRLAHGRLDRRKCFFILDCFFAKEGYTIFLEAANTGKFCLYKKSTGPDERIDF